MSYFYSNDSYFLSGIGSGGGGGSGSTWGTIAGDINDQTDLQAEFAAKADAFALPALTEIVYVNKSGNDGTATGTLSKPYLTINAAMASFSDNSALKPYSIEVGPGVYTESTINMKPYTNIVGNNTTIKASAINQHGIVMADKSIVRNVQITGVSGSSFAGIYQNLSTANTNSFLLNVIFGINSNHLINESTQNSWTHGQNLVYGGLGVFNYGFVAKDHGHLVIMNAEGPGLTAPFPVALFYVSGSNAVINASSVLCGAGSVLSTGTCFLADNGGELRITSAFINNWSKAIYIPNTGSNTKLKAIGCNVTNCTEDLIVESSSASGYFQGFIDITKSNLNSSQVFVVNKDIRIKTVAKIGQDYNSIAAACASITDASPTNRYAVLVGPGVFTEPLITIPDNVSVIGSSIQTTVVEPDANNHDIFLIGTNSEISFMTIQNAGSGYAAIASIDKGNFTQCHKLSIYNSDIGIYHKSITQDCYLYLEYVDCDGIYTNAIKVESTNGFVAFCNAENFYTFPDSSNSNDDILITGPNAQFEMQAFGIGIQGTDTSNGLHASNGGSLTIQGGYIKNCLTGVYDDLIGTNSSINISGVQFSDCNINFNVSNAGTSGSYTGFTDFSKFMINPLSGFFITNQDAQIVTVAKKGGNFDSVVSAMASITDNSSSKRYVIEIGPGIFTEATITMKPFVSIKGRGEAQSTIIQAANPAQTIIVGSDSSNILNVTITGATDPAGIGVYFAGSGTLSPFQIKNSVFGNNYTQANIFGDTAATIFVVENCLMGVTSNQTNGFIISSNPGITCQFLIDGLVYLDVVPGFSTGDLINISGPTCTSVVSNLLTRVGTPTGNGIVASNGAQIRIFNATLRGFLKGLFVENVGAAPLMVALGVHLETNTEDLRIDHPSAMGTFNGDATASKVFNAAHDTFPLLINDIVTGSTVSSGTFKLRFPGDQDADVSTLIIEASTMGNMETNLLSNGGGLVVNVAGGFGYLEIEPEILKRIDWNNTTITVPASQESYIYFNNTGTLVSNNTRPDSFYNILLGRVVTNATDIFIIDNTSVLAEHTSNRFDNLLRDAFGPVYASGSTVTENVTPFHLNVTSGLYYISMTSFAPSGGTNITFLDYFRDGSGGWTINSTNVVENTTYDDGTGTPHAITSTFYVKHSLYVLGEGANEEYFLVRSQTEYSTLLLAQNGNIPTPPSYFKEGVVLISTIIIQQGASTISQIMDERPRIGFSPSGTSASSDHQALSNRGALTAHSQYLLKANTDSMGIDLNMGGFSITNVNLVDSTDVSNHEARHLPNGADPLTTAAPTTNLDSTTTNSVGIQNSLSRSDHGHAITTGTPVTIGTANAAGSAAGLAKADHVHAHGAQTDPTQHAAADASNAGFLSATTQTIGGAKTFNVAPILNSLTASLPLKLDASKNIISSLISLSSSADVTGILPIANGGTNLSTTPTNGQLLIGNGTNYTLATLVQGATAGVTIANGSGSITLDTVQDIRTTATPTFAGLTTTGARNIKVTSVTGTTTLNGTNEEILGDATSASFVINLPDATTVNGRIYTIKKTDSSANTITITPNGVQTIDGAATKVLTNQYDTITIVSNGTNWYEHAFIFSGAGSGITTLNTLNTTSQTFATGTSGTDFNISSVTSTHTFNIPDASATNRGLITTGSQTIAGTKTFSSTISASINGNAATVTTNANLTGPVTSVGNATSVTNNAITNAMIRQSAGLSVIGNSGSSTANVADITGIANQVLRVNGAGTALAFGAIDLSQSAAATGVLQSASMPALTGDITNTAGTVATTIANNAVTDAKIATHTSTKITITTKGQLNSAIVYNDQSNTYGAFDQIFKDANTKIVASADATKVLTFLLSGQTTAKTLTLSSLLTTTQTLQIPNITATDTIATLGLAQTFTAVNTFSSTITGSISGNAGTATALQTGRTINGTTFDGTANITVTAAAGTLTGTTLNSTVVTSSLTSVGTLATLTVTATITGSVSGNAGTATALQTGRTINGVTFDGTGNITVTAAAGTLTGTTLNATVVSSSLTSVGTIATGVWNGTTIAIANGGTGQTTAIAAKDALTTKSTDIASASTTDLSTATGEYVNITGTVTITAFGTVSAGAERVLTFAGALTLTHNATSLILPGSTNITTAANDTAIFRSLGSGNWICIIYKRASSVPISGTNTGDQTITLTSDVTGSGTGSFATTIANNAVTNAKFRQSAGLSVVGVTGTSTANVADITGTSNQVLVINNAGSSLAFGAVNLASSSAVTGTIQATNFPALTGDVTNSAGSLSTTIANNAVSNAKFRQSAGLSVVGVTGTSTANVADITGTANQVLVVNSAGTSLAFGTVNLASTSAVTGTLAATNGGTDHSSYAIGDILYASTTSALSRLADVATGSYLKSGGVTTAPLWGSLDIDSQNVNATAATTTTSTTLVDLAGATLTTAGSFTKNYSIKFSGVFSNGANNVTMSLQLSINGSLVTNTLRTIRVGGTAGANFPGPEITWTASIPVGQIVKIQWDTSGNTLTCQAGTLAIFGIA